MFIYHLHKYTFKIWHVADPDPQMILSIQQPSSSHSKFNVSSNKQNLLPDGCTEEHLVLNKSQAIHLMFFLQVTLKCSVSATSYIQVAYLRFFFFSLHAMNL